MKTYLYFIMFFIILIFTNQSFSSNIFITNDIESSPKEINVKSALNVNVITGNISCKGSSDGWAKAIVSGGYTPYTYNWNTGATTDSIGGLDSGQYTISVTDFTGTKIVGKISISEPGLLEVSIDSGNIDCEGNTTGWARAKVTGGTLPYQYNWSNGLKTDYIGNLANGSYSVTVIDKNGCTDSAKVVLSANPLPSFSIKILKDATCHGYSDGSATINVTAGTPPYTYQWYTLPVAQTTQTALNLKAGKYAVILIDSFACPVLDSFSITQPPELTATITSHNHISCYGRTDGSISVTYRGGTPPYIYSWNTTPPQSTLTLTNLSENTYIFTITDSVQCIRNLKTDIIEPTELTYNLIPTNEKCLGDCNGFIDPNITGGTTPYTYLWNTSPTQTTAQATDLCVGDYNVLVTDNNGCILQSNTMTISTVSPVKASFTANPLFGVTTLNVKFKYDGFGANSYLWDFGNGITSSEINPEHDFETADNFEVLLTVETDTGCIDTASKIIEVIDLVNAFTPDNDGINDIYMKGVDLIILNRIGKELYHGKEGWDGTANGKKVAPGTYYYIITLEDPKNFGEKLHGSVTVVTN